MIASAFARKLVSRRLFPLQSQIRKLSANAYYVAASSTMDLVDMENETSSMAPVRSTMQHAVKHDFCPAHARKDDRTDIEAAKQHWNELVATDASRPKRTHVVAHEMNLIDAARMRDSFDKILLLVLHGESHKQMNGDTTEDSLSERGVGQILSLSRRISTFCNEERRFRPEIVLLPPLRRSVQTALLAIPQLSPQSVRAVPWICHPAVSAEDKDIGEFACLEQEYAGIDYRLCYSETDSPSMLPLGLSKEEDLLTQSDNVLEWIRSRDEQVILVSSETPFLQALGCTAKYERASEVFRFGEMRAIGINYI